MKLENKKVAIVCDWLTGIGGAEKEVLELHHIFPNAPIYTSQYDPKKIDWFDGADVRTLWLDRLPKNLRKFLPVLRAISFSRLNLSSYDLVISASGAEAKAVKTGENTVHVNICHSPTQYYWIRYQEYLDNPGFGWFNWLARIGLKLLVGPMKRWDYKAAQKPNYVIANSKYSQANIQRCYDRKSVVIYPPVDTSKYATNEKEDNRSGFIVVGRQTPYKRIDLPVLACSKLGFKLTVIGDGPENQNLRAMAGSSVTFLGQVDDTTKTKWLKSSEAFIFPGIDDFGIAAVESLAAGTPVIAYRKGGVLDYINKTNGLLFDEQTVDELCRALEKFSMLSFNHAAIRESSEPFSDKAFKKSLLKFIDSL